MAFSNSAYAIVTLVYHLPCVSIWVCDAALWQQCTASSGIKNSRWQRKPRSSTAEMSWLSRVINLITFSVIFYCTKWVVLNAALLLPPGKILILQMLQVTIGLLLFSNLSYFHTADILSKGLPEQRYTRVWVLPQIVLWRKKKKKIGLGSMFPYQHPYYYSSYM